MAITKIGTPELFDFSATNTALQLPSGDTASRPSAPSAGEWRYNTEKKYVEYYDGASWFQIDTEAMPLPSDFPSQNFNVSTYFGTGAAQTIDAKFNEAANFSGAATSNIIIPNNAFPRASANTLAFWVKFANTSDSDKLIFYSYNTSNATRYYIGQAGSYITFRNPDNSSITNVSSSLTANVWAHFAAVSDGAGNYVFYTNGSQSATGSFTNLTDDPTLQKFGDEWKGFLDQTRIYNTNLDATQVNYIYTNETTTTATQLNPSGFPSGCIAAYQLDGDASDLSGNYNGAVSNVGFTGLQFQPDFVWIKNASFANNPQIIDSVRGVTKHLIPATADTEQTYTNGLTAFTANGFTVGSLNDVNKNGDELIAWSLKAGGSSHDFNIDGTGYDTASAAGLDAGDITPTKASANTANGFSIIQYPGNSAASATISHGLSSAPELVIVKAMNLGAGWPTQAPGYFGLRLNDIAGNDTGNGAVFFADTAPTSTVVTVGSVDEVNDGYNYIMYNFHSVDSYQRVGTYTGNASTYGEFVYTTSDGTATGTGGFEPAFLLVKCVSAGSTNWRLYDNKRNTQNPTNCYFNSDAADINECQYSQFNFYSNGFQAIGTDTSINASGATMIYLAIGSNPTPAPVQANSFKALQYTGNSTAGRAISEIGFMPQFTWIKNLGTTESHVLVDQLRYPTNIIQSNSAVTQFTNSATNIQYIGNGFTMGNDGNVNSSSYDYVTYNWKGASIPTINNAGTITSVTSVNDAAGFSIVAYKGTGANATVGHGLQTAPQLILFKAGGSAVNWVTYNVYSTATKYMSLNLDYGDYSSAAEFQNTDPTGGASGVITIGTSGNPNSATYPMVAYCFHDISGYQKVGTYTASGTGDFDVNIGFTPSFLLIKKTSGDSSSWSISDSARSTGTLPYFVYKNLYANTYDAQGSQSPPETNAYVEYRTNGFGWTATQIAGGTNPNYWESGQTYIYLAIK